MSCAGAAVRSGTPAGACQVQMGGCAHTTVATLDTVSRVPTVADACRFAAPVLVTRERAPGGADLTAALCSCREVRRLYPQSFLPTIFISSNCQPEHIVDGLAAGAQDYMTKPVNKQELVARIQAQLQQRSRVRAPPACVSCALPSHGRRSARSPAQCSRPERRGDLFCIGT